MHHFIDGQTVCYRILFTLDRLTLNGVILNSSKDIYEAAIAHSFTSLMSIMEPEDTYTYFTDAPPYFRNTILPEYKGGRVPKPDCYEAILRGLMDLDPVLLPNMEADDLLFVASRLTEEKGEACRIWTVDNDLTQAITPLTEWFNVAPVALERNGKPTKASPRLRTMDNWQTWYQNRGIGRKHWENQTPYHACLRMKAAVGDKGDGFPRNSPPIIYDLGLSPAFEMQGNIAEQINSKMKKADVTQGEISANALKEVGLAIPVTATHYHAPLNNSFDGVAIGFI